MLKLNLGAGPRKIKDFTSVDALKWEGVTDMVWDLTEVPYEFVTEPVQEIIAIEVLEHISFRDMDKVLKEWYRILKPFGLLTVQVPDCGKMMEAYVKGLICECVPHKAANIEEYKAEPWCSICKGKAIVNPRRWQFSFTGAQKHEYDTHKNFFTKEILEAAFKKVGFSKVEFISHPFKLIAKAVK